MVHSVLQSYFYIPYKSTTQNMFARSLLGRGAISLALKSVQCTPKRTFIIRTLDDIKAAGAVKVMPTQACESRRYLLRKDGLGFSFHDTVMYKGNQLYIHYVNHLEAVFIISGSGWIEIVNSKDDLGKGVRHKLSAGTMYALDGHEKHWLGCDDGADMHCVCVFVPPCDGVEAHSVDGAFPFIGEDGVPDYDYWQAHEKENKKVKITLETGYKKKTE